MPDAQVTELQLLARAEEERRSAFTELLGDSHALVEDLRSFYVVLTATISAYTGELTGAAAYIPTLMITFLLGCRYELCVGALACLRGHRTQAFTSCRRVLELAAFAARIYSRPELARVWLEAGSNSETYQRYRKEFGVRRLFPKSEKPLSQLYSLYEICSRYSHPSALAVGGHLHVPEDANTIGFSFFQLDSARPQLVMNTFFWVVDSHIAVGQFFGRLLERALPGSQSDWVKHFTSLIEKITEHKQRWHSTYPGSVGLNSTPGRGPA